MTIGILTVNFHIPNSHSLKDKRQVLQSIKQILRKKFNISISEVEHQNLWQNSLLGICMISPDKKFIDKVFNKIITEFEKFNKGYITGYNTEYLSAIEL